MHRNQSSVKIKEKERERERKRNKAPEIEIPNNFPIMLLQFSMYLWHKFSSRT